MKDIKGADSFALTQLLQDLRISDNRRLVLDLIRDWPESTEGEIHRFVELWHDGILSLDQVRSHVQALMQDGVIETAGSRRCPYAKEEAYTWRVVKARRQRGLFG